MHCAGSTQDMNRMRLMYRYSNETLVKDYLGSELPKTFYRYAFYRNLGLIWGSMHLYNAYKDSKQKTYR